MCPEKCRCQRPIGACSSGSFKEGKLVCPSTGLARLDHRITAKCRLHLLLLALCCLDKQETVFADSNYSSPEMQNIINITSVKAVLHRKISYCSWEILRNVAWWHWIWCKGVYSGTRDGVEMFDVLAHGTQQPHRPAGASSYTPVSIRGMRALILWCAQIKYVN